MGSFIIKKMQDGKVMFNLKAGNGAIIATSQGYTEESSARKGIDSVKKNAPAAVLEDQTIQGFEKRKTPKFELFKDAAGEFRFRLLAANGEIILKSEGYTVKASCKNGIASVAKNAPRAELVEEI